MKENRIYFLENPWPEGHRLKKFNWKAEEKEDHIWFFFVLETEDYYSERDLGIFDSDYDSDVECDSDWKSPSVWGNYHSCNITSSREGFPICRTVDYSMENLDGLEIRVDPPPFEHKDFDDFSFQTYLLGHDSVADHTIKFHRNDKSDNFNIIWKGRIALTYAGDYEYEYSFNTEIFNVKAPEVEQNERNEFNEDLKKYTERIKLDPNDSDAYHFRGLAYQYFKQYENAIEDFNKTIELDPEYSVAYNDRGNTYKYLKHYNKAFKDYIKTMELDPNDEIIYNDLGRIYALLNQKENALEYLEKSYQMGYDDFRWIDEDNDFDNIRGTTEFKALIDQYRNKKS